MIIDKAFGAAYFEAHRQAILDEWFELLRLPTIGLDPRRLHACARAAAWIKAWLQPLGFETTILTPETGLPIPVVLAERPSRSSAATVLFYGHYDVQPEDPLDGWDTPPFEPTLIGQRVHARGAQDNKGQFFAFLTAVRALIEADVALPTLKLLIEGQEESGSGALNQLAPGLRERLRADVLMVSDTSSAPELQPAIVAGLRGVQHLTLSLDGPDHDLHSGAHGGVAPNPAQGMARLLASLHDADGAVAVSGFSERVRPPDEEELALAAGGALTREAYIRETGCPPDGGAAGLSAIARGCFLPTIEVNGVHAGYGGPGSKTIIPATALAKLSMRLVPDQRPKATIEALQRHLEAHCPRGLRLTLSEISDGAPGFRLPLHAPIFRLAADVLGQMDPRGAVFRWEGASIPIVSTLMELSGAAPLLVGFGQEQDRVHAPNESFGLDQFERVMTWSALMLDALA